MSKARKHCKFKNCKSCEHHHNRDEAIWDSNSVDSVNSSKEATRNDSKASKPSSVTPKRTRPPDQMDLDEEAPDEQDYHLWDLELI